MNASRLFSMHLQVCSYGYMFLLVSSFYLVFMLNLNFWINKISWFRHQKPYEKILCENLLQPCSPFCEFSSLVGDICCQFLVYSREFLSMCNSLQIRIIWRLSNCFLLCSVTPGYLFHPFADFFNHFFLEFLLVLRLSLMSPRVTSNLLCRWEWTPDPPASTSSRLEW